jgi:hypothetical protein
LFYAVEAPMDESDAIVAKAFADLAAISVLQHRAVTHGLRLTEVAQAAVEGTLEPSAWASEPDGPLASG